MVVVVTIALWWWQQRQQRVVMALAMHVSLSPLLCGGSQVVVVVDAW